MPNYQFQEKPKTEYNFEEEPEQTIKGTSFAEDIKITAKRVATVLLVVFLGISMGIISKTAFQQEVDKAVNEKLAEQEERESQLRQEERERKIDEEPEYETELVIEDDEPEVQTETNDDENEVQEEQEIVATQTEDDGINSFYVMDSYVPENELAPEDFFVLHNGEVTYEVNDGKLLIPDDFYLSSVHYTDHDRDEYETSKGIKMGDSFSDFIKAYGDYKTSHIIVTTKNFPDKEGPMYINWGMTMKEFKKEFIDTRKVDINDPELRISVEYSVAGNGEKIIEHSNTNINIKVMYLDFIMESNSKIYRDTKPEPLYVKSAVSCCYDGR